MQSFKGASSLNFSSSRWHEMFPAQQPVLCTLRQNTQEECSVSGCGVLPTQGREMILVPAVWETAELNFCLIPLRRPTSLVHQLALGFMCTRRPVIASLYRQSSWTKQLSFQQRCQAELYPVCMHFVMSIDSPYNPEASNTSDIPWLLALFHPGF